MIRSSEVAARLGWWTQGTFLALGQVESDLLREGDRLDLFGEVGWRRRFIQTGEVQPRLALFNPL